MERNTLHHVILSKVDAAYLSEWIISWLDFECGFVFIAYHHHCDQYQFPLIQCREDLPSQPKSRFGPTCHPPIQKAMHLRCDLASYGGPCWFERFICFDMFHGTHFQIWELSENKDRSDILYHFDRRFTGCYALHTWTNCDTVQNLVVCVTVTVFSSVHAWRRLVVDVKPRSGAKNME